MFSLLCSKSCCVLGLVSSSHAKTTFRCRSFAFSCFVSCITDDDDDDVDLFINVAPFKITAKHLTRSTITSSSFSKRYTFWGVFKIIQQPEVGGLVVRMPLEVELYRNHRHSIMGRKLKRILDNMRDEAGSYTLPVSTWYARAKKLVEDEMIKIASTADGEGQIDATRLKEDASEMLSLYLDNQERWQEVCLVVEHAGSDDEETSKRDGSDGSSTTFVLNRPMAFQLTESLARLVLFGAFRGTSTAILNNDLGKKKDLKRFMMAFRNECAVYVGGPDEQGNPAEMIHGIPDLPGAVEISPGTKIYRGGIPAAIEGVLEGKYNPLEFRFFFGCHKYEESALDVSVHLGKFQPVACARSLALKQCISLPKPLWHEGKKRHLVAIIGRGRLFRNSFSQSLTIGSEPWVCILLCSIGALRRRTRRLIKSRTFETR